MSSRTLRGDAVRRVAIAAGALALLGAAFPPLTDPAAASFAGENGLIVFASNRAAPDGSTDFELYAMSTASGVTTQLTDNTFVSSGHEPAAQESVDDLAPSVSPDGRSVAFTSNRAAADGSTDNEIYVIDLVSGNVEQITDTPPGPPETTAEYDPAWSPDGTRIAFRRGDGRKADVLYIDLATGGEQRLDVPPSSGNRAFDGQPAWSPDGNRIAFRKGNGQGSAIWVYDLARDRPFELIDRDEVADSCPAWSPDGGQLAFARGDDGGGAAIWVAAADGSGQRQLTNAATPADGLLYSDVAPSWSPDGLQIVFQSTRNGIRKPPEPVEPEPEGSDGCGGGGRHGGEGQEDPLGNVELYAMNADGSGEQRLTVHDDARTGPQDIAPDWQPIPRPAAALPVVPSASGAPDVAVRAICTSRRVIRITVSFRFRTKQIARAGVFLEGRSIPVEYGRQRTTAVVDLRGRPRGRYTVKVIVKLKRPVTVVRRGQRMRTSRLVTYRRFQTCQPNNGPTAQP